MENIGILLVSMEAYAYSELINHQKPITLFSFINNYENLNKKKNVFYL
jgi:hypothetical protein